MKKFVIRTISAVSAMTFFIALFGGIYLYARFTPVAHAVIDTDTAVELSLNRFGRVIVNRVYHKGKKNALTMLALSDLPMEQAVTDIVDTAYDVGTFDKTASMGIFVCVHAPSETQSAVLTREVAAVVDKRLRELKVPCRVHGMSCPAAFLAAGHNKDVSPASLCMISVLERTHNDPIDAVYERMLKYTPRQLKARYAKTMGF